MIQTGELFFPDLLYILNYIEVNSKLKRRFPTEEFKRAIKQTIAEGYRIRKLEEPATGMADFYDGEIFVSLDNNDVTIKWRKK